MLRKASDRGMFTMSYCYESHEAAAFAEAGVDVMVAHLGLTTGGSIGATDSFTMSPRWLHRPGHRDQGDLHGDQPRHHRRAARRAARGSR